MGTLDLVYWTCLMLGGGYTLITLLLGAGHGHGAGHGGHAGHTGHVGHTGHAGGAATHGHAAVHGHHAGASSPATGHSPAADAPGGASARAPLLRLPHLHAPHAHHHAHEAAAQHGEGPAEGSPILLHLMSYLNPMAVAGFLLGFGGIGLLAKSLGASAVTSALGGLAGGYALWLAAYLLVTRMFGAAEGTSHYRSDSLIGVAGTVTAPIGPASPGMISCTMAGSRQSVRAVLGYGDEAISVGASVRILRIEHGTAHVALEKDALSARHLNA